MVTKEQKDRMTEFVAERLDGSGLYNIVKRDNSHILVAERPEVREEPKTIDVLTHNYYRTKKNLRDKVGYNRSQGIGTAHIFYKDGETFMVRLAVRGKIKDLRSLKHYSKKEIDDMIHLRDLEKVVLDMSNGELVYYQPKTARLEEGIRIFEMRNVALDYSHLKRGDPGYGFARDTLSEDYKLPVEVAKTSGPIALLVNPSVYVGITPIESTKPVKAEQLRLL